MSATFEHGSASGPELQLKPHPRGITCLQKMYAQLDTDAEACHACLGTRSGTSVWEGFQASHLKGLLSSSSLGGGLDTPCGSMSLLQGYEGRFLLLDGACGVETLQKVTILGAHLRQFLSTSIALP